MEIVRSETDDVVYRVEAFQTTRGKRVEKYTEVNPVDAEKPKLMFYGYAALMAPGRPPMNMRFPINAETLGQALDNFDACANKSVQDLQQKEASNIIVPPSGTFTRNGKMQS